MLRDFTYYLIREDGRFCTVQNDSVVLVSDPVPLQYTPDRWLDIEVSRQRNQKYFGLERSFTAPLDFVKDGALILKYFYYNAGSEDKMYLIIAEKRLYIESGGYVELEPTTGAVYTETPGFVETETIPSYYYYYSAIYKGELDFTNFKHAGPKVTVNIMEGGASKLLKAYENTVYEIPIDPTEQVRMTGIRLKQKADYILTDGGVIGDETFGGHTIAIQPITTEGITSIGAVQQNRVKTGNQAEDLLAADEKFLSTGSTDSEVTFTWDFEMLASLQGVGAVFGTSLFLQVHVIKNGVSVMQVNIDEKGSGDPLALYDQTLHWQGTTTITIPSNSIAVLYMSANQNREFTFFQYDNETGSFNINYTYTKAESFAYFIRPEALFKKLAAKMGIANAQSGLLQQYSNIVLLCGDAIRGLPNPVIKTSMSDFVRSFNTVLNVGLTVERDILKLESKANFAFYSDPIALGECKDLKVSTATEYMFNTIKIGFPEQDYEDVNGRQEFNGTHVYTTPHTRITKELDLVSAYRADCYGMEFLRINLEGKTTTDSDSDNDVFMLHIKKNKATGPFIVFDYFDIDKTLNAYATGLLEPDYVYNLYLSPKQCLLRNGSYIRSCFYKLDHEKIKFQSTGKNKDVVISEPGKTPVIEKGDVEIGKLNSPLFQPVLLEFETKVPTGILDFHKASPRRPYTLINDGVTYGGFSIKDSVKPASKEAQTFTLLAAPISNLTYLIPYSG
jgi:hypothetical protein